MHFTSNAARILLAEDDPGLLQASAGVLGRSGYQVQTAGDGLLAWEALQRGDFDLLVTDNHMRRLGGIGLIKKLHEAGRVMPVILLSATLPLRESSRHSWMKVDAILGKPFSAEELVETVKDVISFAVPAQRNPGPSGAAGNPASFTAS